MGCCYCSFTLLCVEYMWVSTLVGVCHVWLCRLECSKSLLSEVLAVDELVMSHERQLSQLSHLSDNSATLRQTREQLQVSSVICATLRQTREHLQVSWLVCHLETDSWTTTGNLTHLCHLKTDSRTSAGVMFALSVTLVYLHEWAYVVVSRGASV